jgi:hypothetical protein
MAESTEEDPTTAYRRRQFDEPWDFIISGILPDGRQELIVDQRLFETWLRSHFKTLRYVFRGLEHTSMSGFEFAIATDLNPLGLEVEGRLYADNGQLELEPVTPRFIVRFLRAFIEQFPENRQLFTIVHTLTYARFNPLLDDEEAMLKLLTDDEKLMEELGVYYGEVADPQ